MWGIGIARDYDVQAEHVSIKDDIFNEKNKVKTFLVIFGLKFQVFDKKYNREHVIRKQKASVGFNK